MGCSNTNSTGTSGQTKPQNQPQGQQGQPQQNIKGQGQQEKKQDVSSFADVKKIDLPNGETYAYRFQTEKDMNSPCKGVFLFLHATLCSSIQLDTGDFLTSLTEAFPNYRFLACDLRGQGNSTYNKKISRNEDFAEDVKLFLEALQIPKVILVGTCMGGYVSGYFASQYPEKVTALILIGALSMYGGNHMFKDEEFPMGPEDIDNFPHFKYIQPQIDAKNGEEVKKLVDGFHKDRWIIAKKFDLLLADILNCRNLREVFYGEAIGNYSNEDHDGANRAKGSGAVSKIKAKTLIIHGVEDKTSPIDHARAMGKAIEGCRIEELPGVDHFTWHDDLEKTVSFMKDFVSKL